MAEKTTLKPMRFLLAGLKLTISLGLLAFFYRRVSYAQVGEILQGARWEYLPPLFALLAANTLVSAYKWKLFLDATAIHIPMGKLFGTYLIGGFLNLFMPSSIGGDVYRIWDVSARSARGDTSFASVFADRLSGFLALVALGLGAAIVGFKMHNDFRILVVSLMGFMALLAMVGVMFEKRMVLRFLEVSRLGRISRVSLLAENVLEAFGRYRQQPGLFMKVMAISLLFQVNLILFSALLAGALRLDVPFWAFWVFVPVITLMEAIPASIYGLGFREAGYVLFFLSVGRVEHEALSMALLYVAVTLLYTSAGGILLAVRSVVSGGQREVESRPGAE